MGWVFFLLLFSGVLRDSACFVSEAELFPYDLPGDNKITTGDDLVTRYDFKVPFTFFNKTYNNVFISNNGQLTFDLAIRDFTPICKPRDTSMIMAFWGDVDLRDAYSKAKLLYRETTNRTLLHKASRIVTKAFPELTGINLSWMFIVTWKDVPFYGFSEVKCNIPESRILRNTFQIILTSDGTHSFALLYYNKITWTTGTASEGTCEGLGGTPAKAGFDYGDGTNWFTIPGSCTNSIVNITKTSNINEPGKWVFRVDSNLRKADCNEFQESTEGKLKLHPKVIPFMGSVPLELEGPCLMEAEYTCIFHDFDKRGPLEIQTLGRPTSDFKKIVCQIPRLNRAGRIKVELSVKPAVAYNNYQQVPDEKIYSGFLYIVNNDIGDSLELKFKASKDNSEVIHVDAKWDPHFFQREVQLDIYFKRRRRKRSTSLPHQPLEMIVESFDGLRWTEHGVIHENIENNGEFHGTLGEDAKQRIREIISGANPELVSISLRRSEREGEVNWSKLGADFVDALKNIYDTFKPYGNLGRGYCAAWSYLSESDPLPNDTLPCPPTKLLADLDINFEQDESGRLTRFFHPGADYSVRQKIPSASRAGSQCVYDKFGNIMVGAPGGGTLDRYSPNYNRALHFFHDVLPYLACCRLSGEENDRLCVNEYYRLRPSDDGTNYPRPRVTRAIGDPHIRTLDGLGYTFNGVGEFWMVVMEEPQIDTSFKMQARMEQYVSSEGALMNASVFTAAVMEEQTAEGNVKVQVSHANDGIVVILDGESLDFDKEAAGFSMNYKSISLTFNGGNKVTLSFSSGFNFEFSTVSGERLLNIVGIASAATRTRGLLGNNDGIIENDLLTPDGTQFPTNSSSETIHYDFGMKWVVSQNSSLFTYPPGKTYDDYWNPSFQPRFLDLGDLQDVTQDVKDSCGPNVECMFDYITTKSASLSKETKVTTEEVAKTVKISLEPVLMCPSLKAPEKGYLHVTNYLIGGHATFSCEEDYQLAHPQECTCLPNQTWSCIPGGEPKCEKPREVKECPTPSPPEHAEIIGEPNTEGNYTIGSKIQIKCGNDREIFWKDCRFHGEGGLCGNNEKDTEPNCDSSYTCTSEVDHGVRRLQWRGYAGSIEKVRCLTRFAGKIADFLKKKKLILFEAIEREVPAEVVEKPYLLGC